MLRSLFSGITGLRQHQTLMDVVSNNISNVNTVGYKASSVIFEDTLSQLVRPASSPGNGVGGVNPGQVGLGVQLGAISMNFAQGSAQNTGRSTDLMIQGDGFFVLQNGNTQEYTRAGSFSFDTDGRLVNPEGMRVQGWNAVNGVVDTNGAPGDIVLPASTLIKPQPSANVVVAGNIQPTAATDTITLGQTVYDSGGVAHPLTITLTGDGAGNYTVDITDANDPNTAAVPTQGSVSFDATGAITVNTPPSIVLPDGTTTVTIDMSKVTRYGGPKSINVASADGYEAGSLQGFQIAGDGSVTGVFSNGQKLVMAKVALAGFNNPMGLEKVGNSAYRATTNSGNAQIETPGSGGVGTLLGGALEMSNVDLAQEFTNLIIAQRGFQANSRVITTSDQMLQDLVDIKR
ncbi:MAG TPA: flagellar hook protein FlgE [Kineosporiaceae bacterium]|nr:flagellar hook protein FlgE [Kineosporiaceae bacterium]